MLDLVVFESLQDAPKVAMLSTMEDTSLIFASSKTQKARVEDIIISKVQGVAVLASLLKSEEEEDEEHIAPVMSSFFLILMKMRMTRN